MKKHILSAVEDAIRATIFLKDPGSVQFIETAAHMIADCFRQGGKLLIAGNGGSLCDAMHFAEELTGVFRGKRAALPAIALSDPGHLTCTANDLGYEDVFSRAVEAFGKENDILISLTTSGNSLNLVNAVAYAKEKKMKTISFLGKTGGKLKGVSDLEWIVDGFSFSDRIQEAHMAAIHIIIEMIEKELFHGHEVH
ncbi:MAG TPA: SIS domain-containing protein [Rhabdochlamydiaceae bacterium]|nr:SIS domain-containing protein [Rhabdochlamydiaceae bacterium]